MVLALHWPVGWILETFWLSLVPRRSLLAHTTWREIFSRHRMAYRDTSFGDVTTFRTKSSRVSGRRTPGH